MGWPRRKLSTVGRQTSLDRTWPRGAPLVRRSSGSDHTLTWGGIARTNDRKPPNRARTWTRAGATGSFGATGWLSSGGARGAPSHRKVPMTPVLAQIRALSGRFEPNKSAGSWPTGDHHMRFRHTRTCWCHPMPVQMRGLWGRIQPSMGDAGDELSAEAPQRPPPNARARPPARTLVDRGRPRLSHVCSPPRETNLRAAWLGLKEGLGRRARASVPGSRKSGRQRRRPHPAVRLKCRPGSTTGATAPKHALHPCTNGKREACQTRRFWARASHSSGARCHAFRRWRDRLRLRFF